MDGLSFCEPLNDKGYRLIKRGDGALVFWGMRVLGVFGEVVGLCWQLGGGGKLPPSVIVPYNVSNRSSLV